MHNPTLPEVSLKKQNIALHKALDYARLGNAYATNAWLEEADRQKEVPKHIVGMINDLLEQSISELTASKVRVKKIRSSKTDIVANPTTTSYGSRSHNKSSLVLVALTIGAVVLLAFGKKSTSNSLLPDTITPRTIIPLTPVRVVISITDAIVQDVTNIGNVFVRLMQYTITQQLTPFVTTSSFYLVLTRDISNNYQYFIYDANGIRIGSPDESQMVTLGLPALI